MLKLNGLAVFVLTLLPMAGIAQTSSDSTAQAEVDNEHHAQVAAIEQVMKAVSRGDPRSQWNRALRLVPARCQSLAQRSNRLRIHPGAGKAAKCQESSCQQLSGLREVSLNDTQKFRPGTQQCRDPHGWYYRGRLFRIRLQRRREGHQSRQRDLATGQSGRWLAHCVDRLLIRAARAAIEATHQAFL